MYINISNVHNPYNDDYSCYHIVQHTFLEFQVEILCYYIKKGFVFVIIFIISDNAVLVK